MIQTRLTGVAPTEVADLKQELNNDGANRFLTICPDRYANYQCFKISSGWMHAFIGQAIALYAFDPQDWISFVSNSQVFKYNGPVLSRVVKSVLS